MAQQYGNRAPTYGAKTSKPPAKNYASLYGLANNYTPFKTQAPPAAWGPGGPGWQADQGLPKATPPVKAPTVKPPSGVEPQPQAPVASGYDWSTDPILQKVQALGVTTRGNAQAEAGKLKSDAAIQYGDENIARQLVGDEGTALAAKGNPFSIVNMLQKDYQDQNLATDRADNQSNLFYSGAHGTHLGENAHGYQQRSAEALGGLQGLFGQIDSNLLQALMGADQSDIAAEQGARDRSVDYGVTNGIDPGPAVAAPVAGQDTKGNALLDLLRKQQGTRGALYY